MGKGCDSTSKVDDGDEGTSLTSSSTVEAKVHASATLSLTVDNVETFLGNCSQTVATAVSFFTQVSLDDTHVNCTLAQGLDSDHSRRLGTPIHATIDLTPPQMPPNLKWPSKNDMQD